MDDVFVAVEKVGGLTLSSPQVTQQQEGQASGQTFLMGVGPRLNPGQPMTVTLSGLPNRGQFGRNIAVGVGVLILLIGLWAAFNGRPAVEAQASFASRRESLFAELVRLERQQSRQTLDPSIYQERRSALLLEIEQVMHEMERRAPGPPAAAGREGAPA